MNQSRWLESAIAGITRKLLLRHAMQFGINDVQEFFSDILLASLGGFKESRHIVHGMELSHPKPFRQAQDAHVHVSVSKNVSAETPLDPNCQRNCQQKIVRG